MLSVESASMLWLNPRTRSTMRASRIEVETINVPQAEIKTEDTTIAPNMLGGLLTSGIVAARCSLCQLINLFCQVEIFLG